MIDKNELEKIEVQDSNCPAYKTNREEKCPVVVFVEDVKAPSRAT